ncbi:nitroreductase family protein [Candidatus Bathyarchaeota archaeon]|jgi:nitroreductase|nr:nitroreductase family protein [Candidatus Bathyarchaeota archaeon]MBT4320059.1 nitroreductase family protein [Candidatus Bathyarchaeota archaeon]MBT4423990.1 nitroreductase family protein [Candidatus Bathyarchaeota archaeon]MBT6605923.1 nitroreductase family protein [Candidatus Bathyarchaeota archaeon]MBT7186489.1 nitroreductase family protein [Candidatus Bathyarchaeota archaeon]
MELSEAIKGRRSIRKFKPDSVAKELLVDILEAGNWAPSAKNGHQWRFTVLTRKAKDDYNSMFRDTLDGFIKKHGRNEAGSAPGTLAIMEEAPVLVIVWNTNEYGWPSEEHSVAAAMQNICLRAYDLGLGSLWIGDVFYAYPETIEYFGKNWKLSGAISIGYPDTVGKVPKKKSLDEVAEFIE